jgi:5-methylcytosine-specific restriction endonuclease McrA
MNIVYDGNMSGKGYTKHNAAKMSLVEYLTTSKNIQSNKIRIKLLEEGYKQHQCERCGLTEWLDQPIPLELHHIDGNKNNNTLENFQLLCPNCHAFTDSYRGKNRAK